MRCVTFRAIRLKNQCLVFYCYMSDQLYEYKFIDSYIQQFKSIFLHRKPLKPELFMSSYPVLAD